MHRNRIIALVLAVLLLTTQSVACVGSFGLTEKLYKWNTSVDSDKTIQSMIMWALIIIPVYELALAGDFLILNLIEYWTGSNPVAANDVEQIDERTVRIQRGEHTFIVQRQDDGTLSVVLNNTEVGQAHQTADKGLVVATDQETVMLTSDEVAVLAERVQAQ